MNAVATEYSTSFFDRLDQQTAASAEVVVPMVLDMFDPASVVDVGCGRGVWLSFFQRTGIPRVLGLDGDWVEVDRLAIPRDSFRVTDLAGHWTLAERFDLALCLEVGEHLPESKSAALVSNLTQAAPVVLFSAALPGQQGTQHINEQWPEYWESLFRERRYLRIDPLRRQLWQDERVAWYYQQNLTIYVFEDVLNGDERLREEHRRAMASPLTLVNRKILKPLQQPRPALKLLPKLIVQAVRRRWRRLGESWQA